MTSVSILQYGYVLNYTKISHQIFNIILLMRTSFPNLSHIKDTVQQERRRIAYGICYRFSDTVCWDKCPHRHLLYYWTLCRYRHLCHHKSSLIPKHTQQTEETHLEIGNLVFRLQFNVYRRYHQPIKMADMVNSW